MTVKILLGALNDRVRKDDELKLRLAKANLVNGKPVRVDTINRWLREDDVILTTATNLDIIRDGLGLSEGEGMLEETEVEVSE